MFWGIGFNLFKLTILLGASGFIVALSSNPSIANHPVLVLATTEGAGTRARSVNGRSPSEDPGYYVEAAEKAAQICGTSVKFQFMPWPRVLKAVRVGTVSAGFASSYKKDRAEYGVYPMKDGKPDETLAQRNYSYSLYAHKDDTSAQKDWQSEIKGSVVGVERASSIIPFIEKLGGQLYEQTSYDSQLNLLNSKRFRFAVGISDNFNRYILQNPDYAANLVQLEPPLQKKVGYVMFGKPFFAANKELVECFWQESAKITKTQWYRDRQTYYEEEYQ